jgi:hypothetical protein
MQKTGKACFLNPTVCPGDTIAAGEPTIRRAGHSLLRARRTGDQGQIARE